MCMCVCVCIYVHMWQCLSTGMGCFSAPRSRRVNIYLVFWDLKKGNLFQYLWMWSNMKSLQSFQTMWQYARTHTCGLKKKCERKPCTAWFQSSNGVYWYNWLKVIMLVVRQNWKHGLEILQSSGSLVQISLGCWFLAYFEKIRQIDLCWAWKKKEQAGEWLWRTTTYWVK